MNGSAQRYDFLYSNAVALGAAVGATAQMEIKTQQDSLFVVQTLTAIRTGRFHAKFSDDGNGNAWNNIPVSDLNLFGTVQRPNILIQPIMVFPTSTLVIDFVNDTAVANNIEIVLGGYKIFQPMGRPSGRGDQWFQYSGVVILGAGQADSVTIKIQSDSSFELQKMVATYTGAPNQALGQFEARLSDSGLGKAWSDRYIGRDNQFGTVEYPRVLPFPKLIGANSTVQVEARDLSGITNQVEVVLEGIKRYRS